MKERDTVENNSHIGNEPNHKSQTTYRFVRSKNISLKAAKSTRTNKQNEEIDKIRKELLDVINKKRNDASNDREKAESRLFSESSSYDSKNGEGESDIDLMLIFGMEEEAKRQDPVRYRELKGNIEKRKILKNKCEYIEPSQKGEIVKKLESEVRTEITKTVLTAIILVLCAIFEYCLYFQKNLIGQLIIYYNPALTGLFALQMLLFIIALSYKRFFSGMAFFTGMASVDSFFSLSSIILFAYYLYLIFAPGTINSNGEFSFNLFLTPYALFGVFCRIHQLIKSICQRDTFKVISSEKEGKEREKTAIESFKRGNAKELFRSSKGKMALAVRRCSFASSFFTRTKSGLHDRAQVYSQLVASLVFSAAIGVLCLLRFDNSIDSAVSWAIFSHFMTMPFSIYLTYSIIPGVTVISQASKGCAIIGDRAFEEYSHSCALYFDDNTIFKPSNVRLKGFNIYEDNKMDDSLYILASIYTKIGSPAAGIFYDAVSGKISNDTEIIEVSRNGIHGCVDGRSVYVGTADYISGCGFDIHGGENEASPFSVLYMAIDHRTAIKVYLDYRIDKKMASTVLALKKRGKYLGIFTCDPSINEEMLSDALGGKKYPVGIIRVNSEKTAERFDSGIVSLKGVDGVLDALYQTIKTYSVWRIDSFIRYFVMASGALISLLFALFAQPGALAAVYSIAVMILGAVPTLLLALLTKEK